MYVYYIVMEIYVFFGINIFSFLYCLCIINISHHSPTIDFTNTILKLLKTKILIPFIILFHESSHSYKKIFL